MAELSFVAPLQWPAYLPETPLVKQRMDHGFPSGVTLNDAIQFLRDECMALNPQRALLSTDVDNLSMERVRKRVGARTGACLSLKMGSDMLHFPCDRWQLLEHNLYAIHLHLRALRNLEKWGVGTPGMAYGGYKEVKKEAPAAKSSGDLPAWMEALGLGPSATLDDAVAVYHRRARNVADDDDALTKLNGVMEQARKALRGDQ